MKILTHIIDIIYLWYCWVIVFWCVHEISFEVKIYKNNYTFYAGQYEKIIIMIIMMMMTNWQDCTWEDLDMAKIGKPQERNWISSNSSTKQCHKELLY